MSARRVGALVLLGGMAHGPAALGVRTGEPPPDRVMAVRGASDFARFQEEAAGLAGTPVLTFHDEILDWVIVDSTGAETGNFIGKYLDALQEGTVEGPCEPAD